MSVAEHILCARNLLLCKTSRSAAVLLLYAVCCAARQGDLLLFAAGPLSTTNKALDRVRQCLAKELSLIDPSAHNLLWVTDFPMFEWSEDEQRLEALHHPFTAPNPDDLAAGGGDLRHARALAYDMVYNGVEIGGGSLRIYRHGLQS